MLMRLNDSGLFIINKIRMEESGVLCAGVMYNQLFRLKANFLKLFILYWDIASYHCCDSFR